MNRKMKNSLAGLAILTCPISMVFSPIVANATELSELEAQSSQLQSELAGINQEILDLGNQVADTEEQIAQTDAKIAQTQEQLSIAKANEDAQYDDMTLRIQYMYENNSDSWIEFICSAKSLGELLNNIEFVGNVVDYDRQKLQELHDLQVTISEQEDVLKAEKDAFVELQSELETKQAELTAKAAETQTDISDLSTKISSLRAVQAAEAAARAAAQQQAAANTQTTTTSTSSSSSSSSSSSNSSSSASYNYQTSGGALTPEKGVVYYNGHRETYYSQRVLPGGGLNIPGRHVASDGTIRDADGYICVASVDYPYGTVVETSLGPAKVYDSGCASGTIDIYTDW